MKLKLKIPTKLTPKQIELIQAFDKAGSESAENTTANASSSGSSSSGGEECKQTFNIQEAWKRLKDFLGTTDQKDAGSTSDASKSSGSSSETEEKSKKSAKAKAT